MNDKMLRILLLGDSRSFKLESYVPELRRQSCEVLLASVENGSLEHYQLKRRGPIRQFHYRLAVPELKQVISEFHPNIIDAHDANYGFMAAVALKSSSIPLSLCLLGPDIIIVPQKSFLHRMKTVLALRRANAVIADSQYLLEEAMKLSSLKSTMVEPFGIEEKYLNLHKSNYELSIPLKIIVPRHQEKVYNNKFILISLTPLLKEGLISLTFADFGSLAGDLKAAAKELDSPNVFFYPKKEKEAFLRFMSEHDVYLSAALTDSSPVSLIDAMAMGLIPIVPNLPGIREWSEGSGTLTYSQNDSDELMKAIGLVLKGKVDPEMRKRNLAKIRQKALFEKYVNKRINLMKNLVNQT